VHVENFSSVSRPRNRKFLLHCLQRINIYNPSSIVLSPTNLLTSYLNYPLLVHTSVQPHPSVGVDIRLLDYSPQTINTKIESSGSIGDSAGKTSGTSTSATVGSSTSETNSYGASVTYGDISGISASFEHSTTDSDSRSSSTGSESSSSRNTSASSSVGMSIKDWGAYALVDPLARCPWWTFGQEFPWDAIECRKTKLVANPNNANQVDIVIPNAMAARLYDGDTLYPPSQLSTFGVNFVMKAMWLVTVEDGRSDQIDVEHVVNYFSGSHSIPDSPGAGRVTAYMDRTPTVLAVAEGEALNTTLNLGLMSLDPLGSRDRPAIVGFIPNKFTQLPAPATASASPVAFRIVSTSNTLMVGDTTLYPQACGAGAGFTASETAVTAAFAQNCTQLEMTMFFKVTDIVNDYTLFLKHWKTGDAGVVLTIVINDDVANAITKYVDALESEGGEKNLLSIVLRNQDYASVDYHDYLQLGPNSIRIAIQPIGGKYVAGSTYQIRAVSIEKA
jgi:hypothetical protein